MKAPLENQANKEMTMSETPTVPPCHFDHEVHLASPMHGMVSKTMLLITYRT
jgi:hypothetical protein